MKERPISSRTRELLNQYGIQLKKSLGQNFLIDSNVLDKIIQAASLNEKSGVIEIGPGIGALTERLAEIAQKVVAIEIDSRFIPILEKLFENESRVEIINGDALKVDLNNIINEHFQEASTLHVVANLPYYVTSPILVHLLEQRLPFSNIVIMIQKEVADRLKASPGSKDYSSLSVLVQYYAEVKEAVHVSSHVFIPRPQVDSSVVCLTLREKPKVRVINEHAYFKIVRAAFAKRRKTLLNSLHSNLLSAFSKKEAEKWILEAGIDPKRRGETLDLQEFAALTEVIYRNCFS